MPAMVVRFFENCRVASKQWWLHLATNFGTSDKVGDFIAKNSTH